MDDRRVKLRVFLYAFALAVVFLAARIAYAGPELPPEPDTVPWPVPDLAIVDGTYKGRTAEEWFHRYQQMRRYVTRRWMPTVDYAYHLASAVFSIPYWQLHSVGACESHHWPFARNGVHKGIFQMWWRPFGFSQYDPVASALSAAQTVRHDGSWRQWSCKP